MAMMPMMATVSVANAATGAARDVLYSKTATTAMAEDVDTSAVCIPQPHKQSIGVKMMMMMRRQAQPRTHDVYSRGELGSMGV